MFLLADTFGKGVRGPVFVAAGREIFSLLVGKGVHCLLAAIFG